MLEYFKVKKTKKIKETVFKEPKPLSIFDYLTDICANKKGNIHIDRDPNLSKFNSYMILQYLSLDEGFLPLVVAMDKYQTTLSKEQMYRTLVAVIPRGRKFLKYPKRAKLIQKIEDIRLVAKYFSCSISEVKEYFALELITPDDLKKIRRLYGGKEKNL